MKLQSTLKGGVDQAQIKNIEKLMKEVSKGKLNKLKYVIVSKFLEIAKSKYLSDDSGVSRSPQSSQQSTPQSTPPTTPEEGTLSPKIQKKLDEFLKERIEQPPKEEDRQSRFIGGIVKEFCDGRSLDKEQEKIITMKVLDFYYPE